MGCSEFSLELLCAIFFFFWMILRPASVGDCLGSLWLLCHLQRQGEKNETPPLSVFHNNLQQFPPNAAGRNTLGLFVQEQNCRMEEPVLTAISGVYGGPKPLGKHKWNDVQGSQEAEVLGWDVSSSLCLHSHSGVRSVGAQRRQDWSLPLLPGQELCPIPRWEHPRQLHGALRSCLWCVCSSPSLP